MLTRQPIIIGAILTLLICTGYTATILSDLNNPSLYKTAENSKGKDPLEDVAKEIRKKIDPTKSIGWPNNYKVEFAEYLSEIYDSYNEFWKLIYADSKIYIDIDNDGVKEYFVISNGLNKSAWGFRHFITILKRQRDKYYNLTDKWKIIFFHNFDNNPAVSCDGKTGCKLRGYELAITDLDRDGRPDILFTTMSIGGSASSRDLNIISMHPDMKIRYHTLWSRKKVEILNKTAIRPIIVQYADDEWGKNDCGVSVRQRGFRKAYYHWTVKKGFTEF